MFIFVFVCFLFIVIKEIQYFNVKGVLIYIDIVGDFVLYGNLLLCEIFMKDVFCFGDLFKKFKIVEGQWYCYVFLYVFFVYYFFEGFLFIQELFFGDL